MSDLSIRICRDEDFPAMLDIINDAARRYRGAVPDDCLGEPYMPDHELEHEVDAGVRFWACEDERGALIGVMGLQRVDDVHLIRHAYVSTPAQGRGVGGALIRHLVAKSEEPILVGTWAAAAWAICFYRKHGFALASPAEAQALLRRYWTVSERQIETSVVLTRDMPPIEGSGRPETVADVVSA